MYYLHALVWAEADERGLDQAAGADLLRRCETVMAAVHHVHEAHRVALGSAHGEDRLHLFLGDAGSMSSVLPREAPGSARRASRVSIRGRACGSAP